MRTRPVAISLLGVLALTWLAWWSYRPEAWLTPTGRDIAQIISRTAAANETVLTPPQAYRNVRMSSAQMAEFERQTLSRLARWYTGERLVFWQTLARQLLNPRDPHFLHWGKTSAWMTNWRIDWVHLGDLTLTPGSATATVGVEVRNVGLINRSDYTAHLVQIGAGWHIDWEDLHFQPGYGP